MAIKAKLEYREITHTFDNGRSFVEKFHYTFCPYCKAEKRLEPVEYDDRYYCWLVSCKECKKDIHLDLPVDSLGVTDENMEWALALFKTLEGKLGFPPSVPALVSICEEFLEIIHNRERGEWLFKELKTLDRFPIHITLRRTYERRHTPADHRHSGQLYTVRYDVEGKNKGDYFP